MSDLALRVSHVSKEYRLGAIGGATLRKELQSKIARLRGKEDPNLKIGQEAHDKNERFLALDDVSFEVKKGERVGILGHNGAGKSTLLKLICRVTTPTKGEICMNGRITSMLEVGTGFHGELTGRENVYLNGAILGLSKAEVEERFDEIVAFSEVGQFIDTPVKRYSSGMHVKLGFAVASHLDSEIMIMDEVLAVGDMAFQNKCINRMREVAENENRTILYVSHNMHTIRQLCSRCIVLDHGKVIFDGEPEQAIEVYLPKTDGEEYRVHWQFDPSQKHHPAQDQLYSIEAFHFADKQGYSIKQGEKLRFFVQIHAEQPTEELFFRMIHCFEDDTVVGMANSVQSDFPLRQGQNLFEGVCDTSVLTPGKYRLKLELCRVNSLGVESLYESVDRIVRFTINANELVYGHAWQQSWWGYCNLGTIDMRPLRSFSEKDGRQKGGKYVSKSQ